VKVGDLVKLSLRKTRKGMPYDDTIGVVTEVYVRSQGWIATATFDGVSYTFAFSDLQVISESR
jgi:hypothetical protein